MATIGNLAVMLSANAAGLSSGLAGAQKIIQGFAGSIQSMAAGGIAGGITAIAEKSIQAMIDIAKETSAKMLELKANSIKAGTSMQEMAGIEGFARGKTEELVHSLQHLNITLGEIKFGSLEAAAGLEKIGIDPDKIMKLSSFERLRSILAMYEKLPSAIEKAAFAKELFKKTGIDLAPVLERGLAGLDAEMQRAADINQALGIDPEQAARNAKRLKAAGARIDRVWEGIKTKIGSGISDVFEHWVHGVELTFGIEDTAAAGAGRKPVTDIAMRQFPDQEKFLKRFQALQSSGANDWLRMHKQLLGELTIAWHEAAISTNTYDMELKKLQETFNKTQIVQAGKLFADTRTPLEQFAAQLDQLNDLYQRNSIASDTYARGLFRLIQAFDTLGGKARLPALLDVMTQGGGQKAHEFLTQFQFGGAGENFQEKLGRVMEQLKGEAQQSRIFVQQILDWLKGQKGLVLAPADLGR